ncbi:MAG: tRNA (N(6)-L-threonylcarbamoyladenosine(37)-C(2))-methylthiotransferase MtaB [Oscillospiraceae bacterium]|nr:tRNA (N(6)-L-threonylcarbamoyladenosine(37)-C(2))-methylthiotransferase MtaB [Oscillospiraceae bacterium]
MRFGFYTLGCKVNQYETQAMEQLLAARGHTIGDFSQKCDGYIINTCSVTAVADKKNRAVIRRCRRENPQAVLAVCGCYPQHAAEKLVDLGVDVIGGSANRAEFIQQVLSCAETRVKARVLDEALKRRQFEVLPAGGLEGRTRAMLKVQDGCVNFCSYCIIPYTRGPIRSAPIELAVEQAKALAEQGYKEITVTGIEIASWGVDLPGKPPLTDLIAAVCNAVPRLRIRLGSLEPRIITEAFCRKLQDFSNLCPQFHLSMQSGCDSVLARMKRKYDTARYYESVELLNKFFPGCAVTTDMIVAFPGETEEEFARSLAFIQKCRFADMHIFPYSRRPGTPADKMPGQHSNAVKEARSREAIALAEKMSAAYRQAMVKTRQEVLFEEKIGAYYCGHTPNYVKVYATGENLHNTVCTVEITDLYRDGLLGKLTMDN